MKTSRTELLAGGVALATIAGVAYTGYHYRKQHKIYDRKFDPDALEELTGTVAEIDYPDSTEVEDKGVELLLKSGEDLLPIHIGPVWFIEMQKTMVHKGDLITVKASRIEHAGSTVWIAMELHFEKSIMRLRAPNGHPYWSAWERQS